MRYQIKGFNKAGLGAILVAGALWLSPSAVSAKAVTFMVGDDKGRDSVTFTSDAPIELIDGHTNKIKGQVVVDDSLDLGKRPLEAQFDVDLNTLQTGIEMRDQHMRDKFLETSKYPDATFRLKTLSQTPTLKNGEPIKIEARGDFTVHGKTVAKDIPVQVTYFKSSAATSAKFPDSDLIEIRANFPVVLAEHGIERPQIVFQKLADTIFVKVAATAHTHSESTKTSSAGPSEKAH